MAFNVHKKKIFITGAGQGIGRACAIQFMEAGAKVIASDINPVALDSLSADYPEIQTHVLDIRDSRAVDAVAQNVGTVDVLFNCAGYVHQGNILECSEVDWELSFDLNIKSMYRTCKAFLPGMVAVKNGNIINVASIISSLKGAQNRCAYGASKAAVIGLTKAIAADFVSINIRCNALCPGTVDTPSLHARMSALGNMDEIHAAFISRQPMGRFGTPEEIAAAALYLASDESSFMTGQMLVIDGGWSI